MRRCSISALLFSTLVRVPPEHGKKHCELRYGPERMCHVGITYRSSGEKFVKFVRSSFDTGQLIGDAIAESALCK